MTNYSKSYVEIIFKENSQLICFSPWRKEEGKNHVLKFSEYTQNFLFSCQFLNRRARSLSSLPRNGEPVLVVQMLKSPHSPCKLAAWRNVRVWCLFPLSSFLVFTSGLLFAWLIQFGFGLGDLSSLAWIMPLHLLLDAWSPIDPNLLLCFTSKVIPKLIVVLHSSETLSQWQTHSRHTHTHSIFEWTTIPAVPACDPGPRGQACPPLKWSTLLWPACRSLGTVSLSLTLEPIVWWLIHMLKQGKPVSLTCLHLSLRVCSKRERWKRKA